MGHAVVSAKQVYPHPVFSVSRALPNATLTIAPMKKFTLSKAIRNDQPAETVTPTVPYGLPLKGSVVELRRAWRGYEKGRLKAAFLFDDN